MSSSRYDYYKSLLDSSSFFKLVCGAGNENAHEVKQLAFIYTLAGCKGFDVSASPEIVRACRDGIEAAKSYQNKVSVEIIEDPIITVSVGMPGDHHVRKAFIIDSCVSCNLCIPVCPTDAIPDSLVVKTDLCIGCGNCEAVCPPAANAIRYSHNARTLEKLLPECIEAGAESIELHAGVPDDTTTFAEWEVVNNACPDNFVSMCLDRYHLTNNHLVERICTAFDVSKERLIIQADGIPMSGGSDDFNTTLQAVSIADIINKEIKYKHKKYKNLHVLISGGTNSFTGTLARQCSVPFSGITIGTHARKVVKSFLTPDTDFSSLEVEQVLKSMSHASSLINTNLVN